MMGKREGYKGQREGEMGEEPSKGEREMVRRTIMRAARGRKRLGRREKRKREGRSRVFKEKKTRVLGEGRDVKRREGCSDR